VRSTMGTHDHDGPRDDDVAAEWVDLREVGVTSYVGHGDSRSGDAGHEAEWGGAGGTSADDDARYVDGSVL